MNNYDHIIDKYFDKVNHKTNPQIVTYVLKRKIRCTIIKRRNNVTTNTTTGLTN